MGKLIKNETMHAWGQRVYGKSLTFSQFFCEPKTAVKKNKVLKYLMVCNKLEK